MLFSTLSRKSGLVVLLVLVGVCCNAKTDSLYRTEFIITSVPTNTQKDASIYLSSSICGWYPDVEAFKFARREDGSWRLHVPHNQDFFQYKITRGSWEAVEARDNGRALPNRVYTTQSKRDTVSISVQSWEDISLGSYNFQMLIMIFCAIQGVLLIVAITTLKQRNKKSNALLGIMLLLISISLLSRAGSFSPYVFSLQPKLILFPAALILFFGPIFFQFLHQLLRIPMKTFHPYYWVPILLVITAMYPFLIMDNQTFKYRVIDQELDGVFTVLGVLAFFYNSFFWIRSKIVVRRYFEEDLNEKQVKAARFLQAILWVICGYLVIWFGVIVISGVTWTINVEWHRIAEQLTDTLWLLFSFIVLALGYFSIKNPEILLIQQKYKDSLLEDSEIAAVQGRLAHLLHQEKVFKEPDLTLSDLADRVPTTKHVLSRVINETYGQTFSTYINRLRVEEFIDIVSNEKMRSYLSAALKVGFSSKATFNRAFKKETGKSPRIYFRMER